MNRRFLICIFCFLLGPGAFGGMVEANRLYAAGDFAGAAAAYEELLAKEGPDAAVYYNLGNSYQSLKRYGAAILAYERARLLTPRDPDLLANLSMARKAVTAFEGTPENPWIDAAKSYLSRNEWSWLVAGGAVWIGAVVLLAGVARLSGGMRKFAWFTSGLAGLAIFTGAAVLYLRRDESGRGIVVSEKAVVRLSPFENAESIGTPRPGSSVRIGAKNGGFQYIEVPGATLRGWMAREDVAAVVPGDLK